MRALTAKGARHAVVPLAVADVLSCKGSAEQVAKSSVAVPQLTQGRPDEVGYDNLDSRGTLANPLHDHGLWDSELLLRQQKFQSTVVGVGEKS